MRVVYPGSFDPITNGHLDVVSRASPFFDEVVVAIGENSKKKHLFSLEERKEMAIIACRDIPNVCVESFTGLLANFCKQIDAKLIIRGLRAAMDFEYELGIAQANFQLVPGLDTFFVPTRPNYSFVSSSTVREISQNGGDVSYYVAPEVAAALDKKRV